MRVIDDAAVRETFVDQVIGRQMVDGVLMLTFGATRFAASEGGPHVLTAARLVIPVAAWRRLADELAIVLKRMDEHQG